MNGRPMEKTVSLQSHKMKKAALRGFREWKRLLPSLSYLDETTRLMDLPDDLILFFCEDTPQSRVLIYDLLMGIYGLGSGYEFESLPPDTVSALLDPFFLITDQIRFDCLRRLGWALSSAAVENPIVGLVLEIRDRIPLELMEIPRPTPQHPAYSLLKSDSLMEREVLIRRLLPEAVNRFREKIKAIR
jgi:hypothetical protein